MTSCQERIQKKETDELTAASGNRLDRSAQQIIDTTVDQLRRRLTACVTANIGHFECNI